MVLKCRNIYLLIEELCDAYTTSSMIDIYQ